MFAWKFVKKTKAKKSALSHRLNMHSFRMALTAPVNTRANKRPVTDAELAALTEAWPMLPDPVKAGILAMVKAVTG